MCDPAEVLFQVVNCGLQLIVRAIRQSTVTRQTAEATVKITVLRNQNAPVFIGNYFRTVDERIRLGSSIVQLSARDDDTQVSLI